MDLLWFIIDLVFPCPQPMAASDVARESARLQAEQAECTARVAQLPNDVPRLREHLLSCAGLLATESDRRSSVDSRLGTIIGLSSIAGSIVFGTMLTANPREIHGWLRWSLAFGPLYLTLQVCSAILASVKGLGRRAYLAATPADVLPAPNEVLSTHLRGQITSCLETIENHRSLNNQKVTQLAVAHRAIQNFVWGLFVLAAAATVASLSAPIHDDLLEKLKASSALRELLRGPQGPTGPVGPKGPAGPSVTAPQSKSRHKPSE